MPAARCRHRQTVAPTTPGVSKPRLPPPAVPRKTVSRSPAPLRSRPAPTGQISAGGWVAGAHRIRSPNQDGRPPHLAVTLVVIHNISLPPGRFGGPGITELFTNRLDPAADPFYSRIAGLRVSAHFLVRRDGHLVQYVGCSRRAWHAGASRWKGRRRCNDFSIGVEVEGTDTRSFTGRQYRALHRLLRVLARAYPLIEVVGHATVAPGRKTDPGPAFDWPRLRAGLAGTGLRVCP